MPEGPSFSPEGEVSGQQAEIKNLVTAEKLHHAPEVTILLERHGKPFRPAGKPDDPEELERVGKLTEEGVQESRTVAKEKAREILEKGRPTAFFFLGSPSEYFIEGEAFGARGQDTAQESAKAVQEVIDEMGLTPEQADIHFFGKDEQGSRPHKALGEPDYFYVDGSDDPRGYFTALQEQYGKEGREEAWLNMPADLEDIRQEVGAQSAKEVSDRVMRLMKVIERYASFYESHHPGRDMVFLMASHGDVMRAVIQHGFGAGEDAQGYVYGTSEMMEITAKDYQATAKFKDRVYEAEL